MAIKIDTDSIVKMVQPDGRAFSLNELNDHVGGFVEPIKIGPVWVMYDEDAKKRMPLNKVASFFFDVAIYGTVLIVPPQQLPADWDIMEDDDRRYSANDVDSGFLMALQTALIRHRVFGNMRDYTNVESLIDRLQPTEEWTYNPPTESSFDENTADFYCQVYDYIVNNPEQFKKNVLLSEPHLMIKLEDSDARERMVDQMLSYFVSIEEYEKCARLKEIL